MNCTRCEGRGEVDSLGKIRKCFPCGGVGTFPRVADQMPDIMVMLAGRKGLRKSRPKYAPEGANQETEILHRRAYYVWRMARFHGGVDMRMPIMASMDVGGDPEIKALDELADTVAKYNFGSNMRAAQTWGRAMGFSKE